MNTNALKKFAQEARRKLLEQVGAKLEYVLHADTPELREKTDQVLKLREAIQNTSKEQVIDKVTYTWFNRFMALRFMDANDYQPIGVRVLTPKDGYTLPALLDEAKQGNIPEELAVKHQKIYDLLDGKIPSDNAQNEAYRYLLIAACNHLNKVFPFLFERINDYTELLLPDDLTSELSIIQDIRDGMSIADCAEVEIVGWLYQFYISEKNEELISSKKVYKKEDLAPASQLFTPKWIVQYMVDNTLGQVWSEINPNTKVTADLEFYIKPAYLDQLEKREKKSIEEIKFFEPCTGSGHILAYAFDVFYKIYEEEGYNPIEIAELIITKNLYGVDIDQRAAQLASFVILMKGRQKNRRFLRTVETKNLQPNISYYQDFEFDNKFKNATALGSLIKIEPSEVKDLKIDESSLFGERQQELKKLYQLLGQRYDVVVTNPPYISSSRMEGTLKQYVEATYPETKSDLFATFILRCLELCNEDGLTGYMTPFVWMFISSFEKLRELIINKHFINNLIQLEYSGFDGATVPICTFTLRCKVINNAKAGYIRLSDFKGSQNQAPRTIEAIQNPNCGWFYTAKQKNFKKIPGSPIGYWMSKVWVDYFDLNPSLGKRIEGKSGMSTCDNDRFMRFWSEVEKDNSFTNCSSHAEALNSCKKWFPYGKGGSFRKWYGNYFYVVNWKQDGIDIKSYVVNNVRDPKTTHWSRRIFNTEYFYSLGITYSDVSSSDPAFRIQREGIIFSGRGPLLVTEDLNILAFLNSKVARDALKLIAPTLTFNIGDILKLPFQDKKIKLDINSLISISKSDWNMRETSWEFEKNEIIRIKGQDMEDSYDLYQQYWKNKFFQLHKNEEELNRQFIEIYGLIDELTPDVPLDDITILKEETVIENGQLVFKETEVFAQFMSYAVGCMFGRYSLDQVGLILANQGDTLHEYLEVVCKSKEELTFVPDEDNIIPVLDDEWFEDDITSRFYEFLKASFGEANFNKNLTFVEKCLGMDVRKYFVKGFYPDHIKRYKKRPIYWMFSSPKGAFNVLIYMHRYTSDTINNILNGYLREFIQKLKSTKQHYQQVQISGSVAEQNKAIKQIDRLDKMIADCEEYEREILYPLATERISIDLDDGVLVNYNKMGKAVMEVGGLNDKATKKKVREFDWINAEEII
jgi:type II restriction/modification system DNA methylase subunit YeeA